MMKMNIHIASVSRGFSLVELMVAITIGLVISIGVVQIFGANRATYQLDEGLARAQENGRFALEFLTQDIRHAGHLGCRRNAKIFNSLAGAGGNWLYPVTSVSGFEYTQTATGPGNTYNAATVTPNNTTTGWTPALNSTYVTGTNGTGVLPGTDVIAVQRLVPNPMPLVAPYVDKDTVYLDPAYKDQVSVGDILMLSDCREAAIFQVTAKDNTTGALSHITGAGSPGNRCGAWENNVTGSSNAAGAACTEVFASAPAQAEIGKLESIIFYVAKDPASGQPTLYKNVLDASGASGGGQALVEGLESFQVLYGLDDVNADGTPDHYVTANNVTDPTKVVSVRIGILVHGVNATGSANDTVSDTEIYKVAETNIDPTPNDKLRRRAFSTTIQLRNRSF
jgi:type IV pilus assembly protein PilW